MLEFRVAGFAEYNVLSVRCYSIFIKQDVLVVEWFYGTRIVKGNLNIKWKCKKVQRFIISRDTFVRIEPMVDTPA